MGQGGLLGGGVGKVGRMAAESQVSDSRILVPSTGYFWTAAPATGGVCGV